MAGRWAWPWCGRRGSNPYGSLRGILSPLRLPVSPRPRRSLFGGCGWKCKRPQQVSYKATHKMRRPPPVAGRRPSVFPTITGDTVSEHEQVEQYDHEDRHTHRPKNDTLSHLTLLVVALGKIVRASCRDKLCQYVYITVVAVSLKKK